jgi:hypothetical protein
MIRSCAIVGLLSVSVVSFACRARGGRGALVEAPAPEATADQAYEVARQQERQREDQAGDEHGQGDVDELVAHDRHQGAAGAAGRVR